MIKADKTEEQPEQSNPSSAPASSKEDKNEAMPSVSRKGDKLTVRLGDEEKTFGITQARKERGYLTFQIGDERYKYYIRKRKLEKM